MNNLLSSQTKWSCLPIQHKISSFLSKGPHQSDKLSSRIALSRYLHVQGETAVCERLRGAIPITAHNDQSHDHGDKRRDYIWIPSPRCTPTSAAMRSSGKGLAGRACGRWILHLLRRKVEKPRDLVCCWLEPSQSRGSTYFGPTYTQVQVGPSYEPRVIITNVRVHFHEAHDSAITCDRRIVSRSNTDLATDQTRSPQLGDGTTIRQTIEAVNTTSYVSLSCVRSAAAAVRVRKTSTACC